MRMRQTRENEMKTTDIFWIPLFWRFVFAISWFQLQHVTASQNNEQWSEHIHIEHPLPHAAGHVHAYPCGVCQECADHMSEGIFLVVGCCGPNIALWFSKRGGCFFLHNGQLSVQSMSCLWLMSWIFSLVSCESTWGEVWYNKFSLLHQRATTISWSMSQMFSQIHAFRDAALMIVQLVHVRGSETICWRACPCVCQTQYPDPTWNSCIWHILSFRDGLSMRNNHNNGKQKINTILMFEMNTK